MLQCTHIQNALLLCLSLWVPQLLFLVLERVSAHRAFLTVQRQLLHMGIKAYILKVS